MLHFRIQKLNQKKKTTIKYKIYYITRLFKSSYRVKKCAQRKQKSRRAGETCRGLRV